MADGSMTWCLALYPLDGGGTRSLLYIIDGSPDAEIVFDGYTVTIEDVRRAYHEQRFLTFGLLRGQVVAVAHQPDGFLRRGLQLHPGDVVRGDLRRGRAVASVGCLRVTVFR